MLHGVVVKMLKLHQLGLQSFLNYQLKLNMSTQGRD